MLETHGLLTEVEIKAIEVGAKKEIDAVVKECEVSCWLCQSTVHLSRSLCS